mgnify:CR=1 FL=1
MNSQRPVVELLTAVWIAAFGLLFAGYAAGIEAILELIAWGRVVYAVGLALALAGLGLRALKRVQG